jgi:hypothetical protein
MNRPILWWAYEFTKLSILILAVVGEAHVLGVLS